MVYLGAGSLQRRRGIPLRSNCAVYEFRSYVVPVNRAVNLPLYLLRGGVKCVK